MRKIAMRTPLVEMDGDEMTRIIWQAIKDILLYPYIDLQTEYYDLGLKKRDETGEFTMRNIGKNSKQPGSLRLFHKPVSHQKQSGSPPLCPLLAESSLIILSGFKSRSKMAAISAESSILK
ncbi:Isopropylmalate dehydrogenase-like domain protein [Acididesulfobacillus acetoxydans]|uniref:4-hydroxythreonine-4-phosphate dehydrogenase PdxA n=1 Tax=Acididesulfobacillus acetoxydans TaxID=1561005 RepID=A0A8S0VYV8_9FIRM|nr:Isopropylmalate dehydrogenase-like domain protein [Acididesulfobacillus acetoxydans]CEJ06500.1 4-hydroxythreonine-4-phosphate dehydrogenase PdxA [Acididesulfobacillus acetoxydans]